MHGVPVVLELAFVHYFASPEANEWRANHGTKAQSEASQMRQAAEQKKGCEIVEACFVYTKSRQPKPWLAVVYASDVVRLVSFAPCFRGKSNEYSQFYVYNSLLEPSQLSLQCLEFVRDHFKV